MDARPSAADPGDDGSPADWSMGRLLSTAARSVERRWSNALSSAGLTHAGLIVLHLLDRGVSSQADLARLAHVEAQTMSRTVDRLERDGFISRERDPHDRRRHVISMTGSGREAWERSAEIERSVFPRVSDQDALRDALLQIIHADRPEPDRRKH